MNKDYIMRMIEQFVQALVAIVTARKAENYEQAFHQIQNASLRFLKADIAALLNKTPDELIEYFTVGSTCDSEQSVICADLIYETALICESTQSDNVSIHFKMLSLNLYLNAIPLDKQFQTPFYMERVKNLVIDLKGKTIPKNMENRVLAFRNYFSDHSFTTN